MNWAGEYSSKLVDEEFQARFFSSEELEGLKRWGVYFEGTSPGYEDRASGDGLIAVHGVIVGPELPGEGPVVDRFEPLELSPDSPLYPLLLHPEVRRLSSVAQLGVFFEDWFSRGYHVFDVALEGVANAVRWGWPPKEVFRAWVGAMLHDPHPALGDLAKYAYGVSEVDLVGQYFGPEHRDFWHDYLGGISQHFGFEITLEEVQGFVERVIRREDDSLPGALVHGEKKSELDLDNLMYTFDDLKRLTHAILFMDARYDTNRQARWSAEVPLPPFQERMRFLEEALLLYDDHENLGRIAHPEYPGGQIPLFLHEIDVRPYMGFVDNKLVITNPEVFYNLVAAAAVVHKAHYHRIGNLGPQMMVAREVREHPELYPTKEEMAHLKDYEAIERFKDTPAWEWFGSDAQRGWQMIKGWDVEEGSRVVRATFPWMNFRLGTLVRTPTGRIDPWKDLYPRAAEPLIALERRGGEKITLVKE